MAHFYGTIQGNRGEASRMGSKGSGFDATAASWEGSIRVYLYYDEERGEDVARVTMAPWHGQGESRTLYEGPIGRFEPTA